MAQEFSLADEYDAFGDDLVPALLPDGDYELVVVKAPAETAGTGKPCLKVSFRVLTGPMYPATPGKPPKSTKDKSVTEQLTWSPSKEIAAQIFAQNLDKLGASQAWIKKVRPSMADIGMVTVGTVVKAKITQDEAWNRNRVSIRSTVKLGPAAQAAKLLLTGGGDGSVSLAGSSGPAVTQPHAGAAEAAVVQDSSVALAEQGETLSAGDGDGDDWP